jgi:hypothetical protein
MAGIAFDQDGVTLRLSREEYWGVVGALNWTTAGRSPADHDFQAIIMAPRVLLEGLEGEIAEAELEAREAGTHWAPLTVTRDEHKREWSEILDQSRIASQTRAQRLAGGQGPEIREGSDADDALPGEP